MKTNLGSRGRMLSSIRYPVFGIALLAFGLLAAGCNLPLPPPQADPTRYYLLAAADLGAGDAPALAKPWVLGVRTVAVPGFLQTRTLAIRARTNEIAFPDFARWGEPLDQGLTRVLAANLQSVRGVGRVAVQPFRADEPRDWEITVTVTACEGTAEGGVRFAARWRLAAPGTPTAVAEGTYTAADLKWDGRNYSQLAAKLSEAVAGLSRDLAAALPKP